MTSRNDGKWDFSRQVYKDHDPFCEPGLISILFLTSGKHELAKVCLDSTALAVAGHSGEVEWVFMEQGNDKRNAALFSNFPADRKVVITQRNYGINNGLSQMWAISRGEFCFIHEGDWWNDLPDFDFLGVSKQILESRSEVGMVQCRAIHDPNENWGYRKPEYNPWSCPEQAGIDGFRVFTERLSSGHEFLMCQFPNAFNNNPNLMRKSLWRECGVYPEPPTDADPRHGETEYAGRVAKTGCAAAHIGREIYYHAGGSARRRFEALY